MSPPCTSGTAGGRGDTQATAFQERGAMPALALAGRWAALAVPYGSRVVPAKRVQSVPPLPLSEVG
jgi:hypothetical protein